MTRDWMDDAACREIGHQPFFADCETDDNTYHSVEAAKTVCATCPVIEPCLDYALDLNIDYGVFGGLSPRQRRTIKHRRTA